MMWLDALAAVLTFFYLPIPIYWLVLHPLTAVWKGRHRAALWTALVVGWGLGGAYIWLFRDRMFAAQQVSRWLAAAGILLFATDVAILRRVHHEMGTNRLVGQAELEGTGELNMSGLYAHVRHPRYSAMMAGMLGVCLMAGTPLLWLTAAVWWALVLLSIWFEERELAARFGEPYRKYRSRVPAFLPFRAWPRKE